MNKEVYKLLRYGVPALMDRFMPSWRHHREELNRSSLGNVEWAE